MPSGRRRKIEVLTDTQPQFELRDTAEDIERRRREREGREEKGLQGHEKREKEVGKVIGREDRGDGTTED